MQMETMIKFDFQIRRLLFLLFNLSEDLVCLSLSLSLGLFVCVFTFGTFMQSARSMSVDVDQQMSIENNKTFSNNREEVQPTGITVQNFFSLFGRVWNALSWY